MINSKQNRISAELNANFYNRLWPAMGRKLHYTEVNRVKFIVDSLNYYIGRNGVKILDFGCGRGWMAPFLSPFGDVTGIDFSPIGIKFAQENYGEFANFILADAASSTLGMPIDCKFDVVVCSEVVEHVPDQLSFLYQLAGFLHSDGWLLLTAPNGNLWQQFKSDSRYISNLQPVENWVTPQNLKNLLQQVGFQVKRHEGRPYYEFSSGFTGWLQSRYVESVFRRLGLPRFYARLILPTALYQVVVAQKMVR